MVKCPVFLQPRAIEPQINPILMKEILFCLQKNLKVQEHNECTEKAHIILAVQGFACTPSYNYIQTAYAPLSQAAGEKRATVPQSKRVKNHRLYIFMWLLLWTTSFNFPFFHFNKSLNTSPLISLFHRETDRRRGGSKWGVGVDFQYYVKHLVSWSKLEKGMKKKPFRKIVFHWNQCIK